MTYAGFVFDALASLAGVVAILFAVKAYGVSVRAYEVSNESYKVAKEQGRKTFELEVLRDLLVLIDGMYEETKPGRPGKIPPPSTRIYSRILLHSDLQELDLWQSIYEVHMGDKPLEKVLEHPLVGKRLRAHGELADWRVKGYVLAAMHEQVLEAIKRRKE